MIQSIPRAYVVERNMKNRFAIVGLGNIGYQYDSKTSSTVSSFCTPKTHFTSIIKSGHDVSFAIETDITKIETFRKKTGLPAYETFDEGISSHPIDSLCLSVPTINALAVLKNIEKTLYKPLDFVIVEKPVGVSFTESNQIINIANRISSNLIINYSREFSIGRQGLSYSLLGKPMRIDSSYSLDLRSNSCHFLRLLLGFFPNKLLVKNIQILKRSKTKPSFKILFESNEELIMTASPFSKSYFKACIRFENPRLLLDFQNENFTVRSEKATHLFHKEQFSNLKGNLGGGMLEIYKHVYSESIGGFSLNRHKQLALQVNEIMDIVLDDNLIIE